MAIRVHLAASLLFATVTLSAQTTPAPTPNANNVQTPAQTLLGVQSHDMLYKTSRDILYTPALVPPAGREQGWRGRRWM